MDACWGGTNLTKNRSNNWYVNEAKHLKRRRNWAVFDTIFIPLSFSNHWVLFVMQPNLRTITIMDPIGNSSPATTKAAKRAIHLCECMRILTVSNLTNSFDLNGEMKLWNIVIPSGFPKQQDGHNCGVFICMYARSVMENRILQFSSSCKTLRQLRFLMLRKIIKRELLQL